MGLVRPTGYKAEAGRLYRERSAARLGISVKDWVRQQYVKHKYGLSVEQYAALERAQGGM